MIFHHHDLSVTVEDHWLVAAGAESFVPSSMAYIVDATPSSSLISIDDIKPVRRAVGVPLFNISHDGYLTAEERVLRILRALLTELRCLQFRLCEPHPKASLSNYLMVHIALAVFGGRIHARS
jgi:hypothetical protein